MANKFGLVYTLLHRSFSICSSYEKFHEKIVLFKGIFKKNEYPQFFIDKCINKYLSKFFLFVKGLFTMLRKSKSC